MPDDPTKATMAKQGDDADYELELTAVAAGEEPIGGQQTTGGLGADSTAVPRLVSYELPKRLKGKLFSLKNNGTKKNAPQFFGPTGRSFNYEEMYDEDAYGEEAFPDARVWKVYNDEAQLFDVERIEAWRDAVDVLLVFIGLFAAVVSAFLVETSKSLQPDYAQVNVMISYAILRSLNSSVLPHSTLSPDILNPHFGEANHDNSVVNALWYTSLTISLSTALLAMLVKQWLHQYMTSTSGTARERARIRHFRFVGLEQYRVPTIIDLLPTLLHLALGLFLVGLALYLRPLNRAMFGLVVVISSVPYVFYFVSITMPFFDPQCPYRSPPSFYIYPVQRYLLRTLQPFNRQGWVFLTTAWGPIHSVIGILLRQLVAAKNGLSQKTIAIWSLARRFLRIPAAESQGTSTNVSLVEPAETLSSAEKHAVLRRGNQLDVDSMVYLCQTSSNTNVRNIALEAFGGLLPSGADVTAVDTIINTDLHAAIRGCRAIGQQYDNIPSLGMERRHNRLIRALCIQKRVEVGDRYKLESLDGYPAETDPCKIYSQWLFPSFEAQGYDLVALFTFSSQHSFPLSTWAALIRVAKQHNPKDTVIRAVLVAPLHLPIDSSEVGSVTLGRALQHPFIRDIAREYLAISDLDDLISLSASSITFLLAKAKQNDENIEHAGNAFSLFAPADSPSPSVIPNLLSSILPPLLQSLSHQVRDVSLGEESTAMLHTLLTDFFSSPHINYLSWETLSSVLEAWCAPSDDSIRAASTPVSIHAVLYQFRCRGHPLETDTERIRNAVEHLASIFYLCCNGSSPDVREKIFSSIRELDLLPVEIESQSEMSPIRLFWSAEMWRQVIDGTAHHSLQRGVEWFNEWAEYIHVPERLEFICSQLIRFDLYDCLRLCWIRPEHLSWPEVIKTLLSRFHDQSYLESVVDWGDQRSSQPRKELSERLLAMKSILEGHHPILSQPDFDIPQFDDEDNLIPSYSTAADVATPSSALNAYKYAAWPEPFEEWKNLFATDSEPSRSFASSAEHNSLDPSSFALFTSNLPFEDSSLNNNTPMSPNPAGVPVEAESCRDAIPQVAAQYTPVDMANLAPLNAAGSSLQDSFQAQEDRDLAKRSAESRAEMGVVDGQYLDTSGESQT